MASRPLTILHAAETIRGGVASVLRAHLAAQNKADSVGRLVVVVPSNQVSDLELADLRVTPVTFRRAGRTVWALIAFSWVFLRTLLQERPDIVHLHSSFAGALGRLILLSVRLVVRPKVVYCPHGFVFIIPGYSERSRGLLTRVELVLTAVTDAIICVSQYELQLALSQGFRPEKLCLINNGIDIEMPATASSSATSRLRRDSNDLKNDKRIELLFVGRLDYAKGFDVLYSTFRQLDSTLFHLTVVGERVLSDLPEYSSLPNMQRVGWLPPHQLAEYYSAADVLLVPSRWEAFGLVVVEAAAFGCPALASDAPAIAQLIEDGVTGRVFKLTDPNTLVSILQNTDKAGWSKMGENANAQVAPRYTAARMCQETLHLYSTLMSPYVPLGNSRS